VVNVEPGCSEGGSFAPGLPTRIIPFGPMYVYTRTRSEVPRCVSGATSPHHHIRGQRIGEGGQRSELARPKLRDSA